MLKRQAQGVIASFFGRRFGRTVLRALSGFAIRRSNRLLGLCLALPQLREEGTLARVELSLKMRGMSSTLELLFRPRPRLSLGPLMGLLKLLIYALVGRGWLVLVGLARACLLLSTQH